MKRTLFASLFILLGAFSSAFAETPSHRYTPEQNKIMLENNQRAAASDFVNSLFGTPTSRLAGRSSSTKEVVPFAEYHEAGYLIISESVSFNSQEVKRQLAKNLPAGVTLVIFTGSNTKATEQNIIKSMSPYIDPSRLKVVYLPTGDRGFWARDGVPVPVWQIDSHGNQAFTVVDAKYYHNFEADQEVADLFSAELFSHTYYFEGGNFINNAKGDCIIVDNARAVLIPRETFSHMYGCKTLLRLPHIKGIGHADESVKFVNDDTVLTDSDEYEKSIQAAGFKTIRLPRPDNSYETYVNSLIINGTVFIPVFNEAQDAEAVRVYASLGLKTIPLNSKTLSNDGLGSIHCITMTYPAVPFRELVNAFSGN